ncbi:MAG: serine/threonine protein kinase [Myxococcota bacterium]|nr:serine/threonine protein kinase [Myxococcota bacterium]
MIGTGATRAVPQGSEAGAERIYRHQHAAEILRARSVLVAACILWVVCGAGLDLATHRWIGTGSLTFVLAVRFATTAFHVAVVLPLFRSPLPSPRVAEALAASVFPVSSFALMLIATLQGGLTSPYVTALFVIVMGQTIAWPSPWRTGVAYAALSSLIYPVGLLVATRFDADLRAQLHDGHSVAVFATYVAVIIAGAIIAVWGGHVMWSLRRSVFESRKLGRYRLLKRVGKGGMGEVWSAEDRALRRSVALKILSPEYGRKPAAVARFEREIQATAAIAHPSVVRIHDWGVTDDGVWYYAMDLLEGTDLADLVEQRGTLPPALALHLFIPAAAGLGEAHRRGIIHRDLKPANMFVVATDHEPRRIELVDFGIARVPDDAEVTQAGVILGTPGYMAPEILAGAPATVASDIYGFAATFYYALTRRTPHATDHAPVSASLRGVSAQLDDALVRALDKDPGRRHATAEELAAELRSIQLPWSGSFRID